jgi:hypothetical protein
MIEAVVSHQREVQLSTSRFQAADTIIASGMAPVRISRGAPRWKLRYEVAGVVKLLAPSKDLYDRRGSPEFEFEYIEQLDALTIDLLTSEFHNITGAHRASRLVLLCFEDVGELGEGSCHRRMFARWWESQTGRSVPEL